MNHMILSTSEAIRSACTFTTAKCVGAIMIILANMTFGDVDGAILIGIGMLCLFDFLTALIRDKKGKVKITSRKAIKTPLKIAVYALMVSAGYVTESVIGLNAINLPIAETIAAFIAVTELISILENVGRMGYVIPRKLLNFLEDYAKTK